MQCRQCTCEKEAHATNATGEALAIAKCKNKRGRCISYVSVALGTLQSLSCISLIRGVE